MFSIFEHFFRIISPFSLYQFVDYQVCLILCSWVSYSFTTLSTSICPCQIISSKTPESCEEFYMKCQWLTCCTLYTLPWSDNCSPVTTGSEVLVVQLYSCVLLTYSASLLVWFNHVVLVSHTSRDQSDWFLQYCCWKIFICGLPSRIEFSYNWLLNMA